MGTPFAELIARRHMCRDFRSDPIPRIVWERIVEAGLGAPAAGNTHGFDVVALSGASTARYWDVTLPGPRRASFRWPGLLNAPVLLLAYVDPGAYLRRYSEPDKSPFALGAHASEWSVPYWFVDGGAAVMAMLLAAHDEGLGALFFGQFGHEAALRGALGVPEGHRAVGTVAVGHPRDGGRRSASAARGRPDLEDRLHVGCW